MNHTTLRWYTVYYTVRNSRRHLQQKVEVSATSEAEALLRARDHARIFKGHRIHNPIVRPSNGII